LVHKPCKLTHFSAQVVEGCTQKGGKGRQKMGFVLGGVEVTGLGPELNAERVSGVLRPPWTTTGYN